MTTLQREIFLKRIDNACVALRATGVGGRLAFLLTGTALLRENNPRIDASDLEEGRYRLRAALIDQIADLEELLEIVGE